MRTSCSYAVNSDAPNHTAARSWLDGALSGGETVAFPWSVLLAFLRLATHPAVFPSPLSADTAIGQVREWLRQPSATVAEPGTRHLEVLAALLEESFQERLAGRRADVVALDHGDELGQGGRPHPAGVDLGGRGVQQGEQLAGDPVGDFRRSDGRCRRGRPLEVIGDAGVLRQLGSEARRKRQGLDQPAAPPLGQLGE